MSFMFPQSVIFFKNEQVQKGETVLQIIQEQLKVRKLILIN